MHRMQIVRANERWGQNMGLGQSQVAQVALEVNSSVELETGSG